MDLVTKCLKFDCSGAFILENEHFPSIPECLQRPLVIHCLIFSGCMLVEAPLIFMALVGVKKYNSSYLLGYMLVKPVLCVIISIFLILEAKDSECIIEKVSSLYKTVAYVLVLVHVFVNIVYGALTHRAYKLIEEDSKAKAEYASTTPIVI